MRGLVQLNTSAASNTILYGTIRGHASGILDLAPADSHWLLVKTRHADLIDMHSTEYEYFIPKRYCRNTNLEVPNPTVLFARPTLPRQPVHIRYLVRLLSSGAMPEFAC